MARIDPTAAGGRNVVAFLDLIAASEIGHALLTDPTTDDGYRVCVGSTPGAPILFQDYADHPRKRDEALNSDAAGRYQFLGRYWRYYRAALRLPDFGPVSQDKWAMQLIRECHAMQDIRDGLIASAVEKCRSRWASFPGAGYGQRENHIDNLLAAYTHAGGALA